MKASGGCRSCRRACATLLVGAWLAVGPTAGGAAPAAAAPEMHNVATAMEQPADGAPGYPWRWPAGAPQRVVQPFRAPEHDYGPGHRGMDVAAGAGVAVLAPAAGVVAFRGTVVDRPLVTIDHGAGYVTTLEPVESELMPGAVLGAGDAVGRVAAGGHTARGALHVGVRIDGEYVNPRGLFGSVPRAVLLPCCER